eukprot:TRINITY_DN33494_c0_g1_i1.p1 TRINITY_DN33494_c0_g1~~TRINITY_DN33494_c0_g1_i1.p1  ORF type:complete len:297 (-),score=65.14 TRINITY_DN33494_c0_g1_i1:173-985(-)
MAAVASTKTAAGTRRRSSNKIPQVVPWTSNHQDEVETTDDGSGPSSRCLSDAEQESEKDVSVLQTSRPMFSAPPGLAPPPGLEGYAASSVGGPLSSQRTMHCLPSVGPSASGSNFRDALRAKGKSILSQIPSEVVRPSRQQVASKKAQQPKSKGAKQTKLGQSGAVPMKVSVASGEFLESEGLQAGLPAKKLPLTLEEEAAAQWPEWETPEQLAEEWRTSYTDGLWASAAWTGGDASERHPADWYGYAANEAWTWGASAHCLDEELLAML